VLQGEKKLVLDGVIEHFVQLDKMAKAQQAKHGYIMIGSILTLSPFIGIHETL
jgi:hypothetical protein